MDIKALETLDSALLRQRCERSSVQGFLGLGSRKRPAKERPTAGSDVRTLRPDTRDSSLPFPGLLRSYGLAADQMALDVVKDLKADRRRCSVSHEANSEWHNGQHSNTRSAPRRQVGRT